MGVIELIKVLQSNKDRANIIRNLQLQKKEKQAPIHIGIGISQTLNIWLISRARPIIGFNDLFSRYRLIVIDIQHISISYNLIIGIGKGYLY